MSRSPERTLERELSLIRIAVRIARTEFRAGKRSAASLRDVEERALRDEQAVRAAFASGGRP